MSIDSVVDLFRGALYTTVRVAAPILIVSLVVGLLVSILQTVTSIQEQTLSFVPKLLAIFAVIALAGSFILGTVTDYTIELFSNFDQYIK